MRNQALVRLCEAKPHLRQVAEETYRLYYAHAVENIAAWLAGVPLHMLS